MSKHKWYPTDEQLAEVERIHRQNKIIYADKTSGSALAICPYCRKVVGKTTVILSTPFYPDLGNDQVPSSSQFEMLNIEFQPVVYCQCREVKP